MKSQPECELLFTSLAQWELLTYLYEIPSRLWAAVQFLGFIEIIDMFVWNPIQYVSWCASLGLCWNCWDAYMKSHPACELVCTSWASLELLRCFYEIPSRMWVAVHLLGFIGIAEMLLWNPIQDVSCCTLLGLHRDCWHAPMKSHPGCKLLCISWAPLELLTCPYEIPSRMWVAVHLLGSFGIADMPPWNPIQYVSCCAPLGLLWNCWHATMKSHLGCELLYTS